MLLFGRQAQPGAQARPRPAPTHPAWARSSSQSRCRFGAQASFAASGTASACCLSLQKATGWAVTQADPAGLSACHTLKQPSLLPAHGPLTVGERRLASRLCPGQPRSACSHICAAARKYVGRRPDVYSLASARMYDPELYLHVIQQCELRLPTGELTSNDAAGVRDLLSQHPAYGADTAGIHGFEVAMYQGRQQLLVRSTDGSTSAISRPVRLACILSAPWHKAQTRSRHPAKSRVGRARAQLRGHVIDVLRSTVSQQVDEFRAQVFSSGEPVICPETRAVLHNDASTHIDHDFRLTPFSELVEGFCKENKYVLWQLNVFRLPFCTQQPLAYKTVRLLFPHHQTVRLQFQQYHREHAKLRAVAKSANLKGRKWEATKLRAKLWSDWY